MKISRLIIGFILSIYTLGLSARPTTANQPSGNQVKTLWVVDGVALNDSVFDYTLDQMKSDSAVAIAASALYYITLNDIIEITVSDSIEAVRDGFVNCNGVVKIMTSYQESLPIIIDGMFYKSKSKVSAGDVLGGQDYIKQILMTEFADLDKCGISGIKIIKDVILTIWLRQRTPTVVVTTKSPYYRIESLVGDYVGKSGKYVYTLKLNADSTYEFTRKDTRKKTSVQQVLNFGTCNISKSILILNTSQDQVINLHEYAVIPDTIYLNINNFRKLTLPGNAWSNKKSVSLQRQ